MRIERIVSIFQIHPNSFHISVKIRIHAHLSFPSVLSNTMGHFFALCACVAHSIEENITENIQKNNAKLHHVCVLTRKVNTRMSKENQLRRIVMNVLPNKSRTLNMRTLVTKHKRRRKNMQNNPIFVTRFYANVWQFQEATN